MSTQPGRRDDNDSRLSAKRSRRQAGFSLPELLVVLVVVAIIAAMSTPLFLNYYRTAQVRGAASDIAAYLNQGRQLALQRNTNVCVRITASAMHYHLGGCGGPALLRPGTHPSGHIPAPGNNQPSTTPHPLF